MSMPTTQFWLLNFQSMKNILVSFFQTKRKGKIYYYLFLFYFNIIIILRWPCIVDRTLKTTKLIKRQHKSIILQNLCKSYMCKSYSKQYAEEYIPYQYKKQHQNEVNFYKGRISNGKFIKNLNLWNYFAWNKKQNL